MKKDLSSVSSADRLHAELAATRDILDAIRQLEDDEGPVFKKILQTAAAFCGSSTAGLALATEDRTRFHIAAAWGEDAFPFRYDQQWPLSDPHPVPSVIRTGKLANIPNLVETELYQSGDSILTKIVEASGNRSWLVVPLLKDGVALGALSLSRNVIEEFTDTDVSLVQSFAAQAVIAINNAKRHREVQIRLDRESATRKILETISLHRDNDQPVFDEIANQALALCGADRVSVHIVGQDGQTASVAAHVGDLDHPFQPGDYRYKLDLEHPIAEAIQKGAKKHVVDLGDDPMYHAGRTFAQGVMQGSGYRTLLVIPFPSASGKIGALALWVADTEGFQPDQIELARAFAAQAAIALENVRQYREIQTRLEREAATREILEAISTNRDDGKPVFDVILRKAMTLCGATQSALLLGRKGGDQLTLAALLADHMSKADREQAIFDVNNPPQKVDPEEHIAAKAICEARVIEVEDLAKTKKYLSGNPTFQLMVDDMASHTMISVPLMDKEGALGAINLHREEIQAFGEDEIELVKGFAAQAAIAVENARQFKALEKLNAELGDRVEEQVSEIERMGRLKRFLPAAVADTVVSSGKEDLLNSHRALLGILFCDIRGFTAFCESAEPEETIEVLQTYHQEMGKLIAQFGAGVDHRMGDGIMVLFNDPVPCDDPAGYAVRLAMAMRDRMQELCRGWKRLGHRLGFGVGVSLGYATVGMVGYEGRFDYTASGTAVNLAARLCDQAEDGEILLSPRAQVAVEDTMDTAPHAELELKGISAPVEVFRLVGIKG